MNGDTGEGAMSFAAHSHKRVLLVAILALYPMGGPQAGGFYVPQKGPLGVGFASAGGAAYAGDASTVFFNPAGMVLLPEPLVQGGIDFLVPDVKIANRGSSAATPGTLGAASTYPGTAGDAGKLTPIPNFYYTRPLSSGLWFGFAVTAPFGLGLDYGREWFGRYDSIKSKLVTVNISPALAWRVGPNWSIGGGVDLQYADAELTNAIPDPFAPGGPSATTDGFARLTGNGWAAGFNVGVHYHPSPDTRMGAHYRSGIRHRLAGDATIQGLSGPLAAANGRFDTKTAFRLPPIASFAIAQKLGPNWTLLGEAQWFGWSDFDEVRIRFANGSPDAVRPQRFRDSHSLALGVEYGAGANWTLRGGLRVEKTPTVDAFRNTSIPDSDLRWAGVGASYRYSRRLTLDFGYLRAAFRPADINLGLAFFDGTPAASAVQVRGRIDSKVDTFSLSLRYRL
jgi:long-chain fatty acid transport protein